MSHGYIEAKVPNQGRLKGAHIVFEKITVTGPENILMAAVLADGETVLENSAREPEVTDLVVMLRKMGAQIEGDGTSTLRIRGVDKLHGTEHSVIPDRIEAGAFLVAGAITGGDLTITMRPRTSGRHHCQDATSGSAHRRDGQDDAARAARCEARRRRYDHRGVPWLRDRYAGAVHGASNPSGRCLRNHRNDLREPLPPRQRNGAHGC